MTTPCRQAFNAYWKNMPQEDRDMCWENTDGRVWRAARAELIKERDCWKAEALSGRNDLYPLTGPCNYLKEG